MRYLKSCPIAKITFHIISAVSKQIIYFINKIRSIFQSVHNFNKISLIDLIIELSGILM